MYTQHQPHPFRYKLMNYLQSMKKDIFTKRIRESDLEMRERGITFTVYSDAGNIDRAWPFDIIPRLIPKSEWDRTEMGLKQRMNTLNQFIQDSYDDA